MALNQRTVILGVKTLRFVRNGTTDGEDTVGAAHAPETNPLSALYESLGDVESATIEAREEALTLRSPRSGAYKKRKSIPLGQETMIRATLQDATQITFESLFRFSGAITVGTGQIPNRQSEPVTGWIWLELWDQTRTKTVEVLVYAELRVNQLQVAERQYSHELMIDVLENDLNLINLAALAAMAN
jgi:hypothetical protein